MFPPSNAYTINRIKPVMSNSRSFDVLSPPKRKNVSVSTVPQRHLAKRCAKERHNVVVSAMAAAEEKNKENMAMEDDNRDGVVIAGRSSHLQDIWECPLFLTSLPSDFASNPGLAAIASLVEDGENKGLKGSSNAAVLRSTEKTAWQIQRTPPNGGGKCPVVRAQRSCRGSRHSPYRTTGGATKAKGGRDVVSAGTTLGEAQLFLKMWKI